MINRWQVVLCITQPCRKWQTFQEESLKVEWNKNQDSSMVERQARDVEVQVRIPVQVEIFLLKFIKYLLYQISKKLISGAVKRHCVSRKIHLHNFSQFSTVFLEWNWNLSQSDHISSGFPNVLLQNYESQQLSSSKMICSQHDNFPVSAGFINRNYQNKSVIILILHGAGRQQSHTKFYFPP